MKLKKYSIVALVLGFISALVGALAPVVYQSMQSKDSVGVIGGAGALTYRFLLFRMLDGLPIVLVALGLALIISAVFCLVFSKTVKANCTIKTSIISIALSVVSGFGLYDALWWYTTVSLHGTSIHIQNPSSVIFGIALFLVLVFLIFLYFKARKSKPSVKGILIDIATALVFFPTFLMGAFSWMG